MIIKNAFPEYEEQIRAIDRELYFTNLVIEKGEPGEAPRNQAGKIIIPFPGPEEEPPLTYVCGEVAHEGGHNVVFPITGKKWAKTIMRIRRELSVDGEMALVLANVAGDIVTEHEISQKPTCRRFRGEQLRIRIAHHHHEMDLVTKELGAVYNKIYGLGLNIKSETWEEIEPILRSRLPAEERVMTIARVLYEFIKRHEEDIRKEMEERRKMFNPFLLMLLAPCLCGGQQGQPIPMPMPGPQGQGQGQSQEGQGQGQGEGEGQGGQGQEGQGQEGEGAGEGQEGEGEGQGDGEGQGEGQGEGGQGEGGQPIPGPISGFGDLPFELTEEEMEEIIEELAEEAENLEEMEGVIRAIQRALMAHKGLGLGIGGQPSQVQVEELELLVRFYEAKAKRVRLAIDFPKRPAYQGIRVGHAKWRPTESPKRLDIRATIMRHGVAIPALTTLKPRIMRFNVGYMEEEKLIDLVISIDTSGSTGRPSGIMGLKLGDIELINTADHEAIMVYALIDLAKKINQKVGLTLWSGGIVFTTLPKTYSWGEMEKLKRQIITTWAGGTTRIKYALQQAKKFKDKVFFIITDGKVYHRELIEVDNVIFFLINPSERDYQAFVEKYGQDRVIKVEDVRQLPKIAINVWKALFWRG